MPLPSLTTLLLIAVTAETLVLAILFYAFRNWTRRFQQFYDEGRHVMASHQDSLANHESRLQRLGSPGQHIFTMAEMAAQMPR